MNLPKLLYGVFMALTLPTVWAQVPTQTIRGTIIDHVSQSTLPGANVYVLNTVPLLGATSDVDGFFKIENVPVGTYNIKASFVGYKEVIISGVVVISGKEKVLLITLEEDITKMEDLVVEANQKDRPINEMAAVSTRTFSVEETRKYSAAFNDPARTATSFAGVTATNDGNNAISIRGNSPFGLLWRMEGVEIPNPNHFASPGSSGGGIAILSAQLLANSDFSTGAFAAEYGNALSGVFDLRLRKGNNERAEKTVQIGVLGTDVALEGPFSRNYKGSYLVNYRYSTLSLLEKLGVPLGDNITNFQDLSFNLQLPVTPKSTLSIFGFGGLSAQTSRAEKDSIVWETMFDQYNARYVSNTGVVGIKYSSIINARAHTQHTVVFSGTEINYAQAKLDKEYQPRLDYQPQMATSKFTWSSILNLKLSSRNSLRSGVYVNQLGFNIQARKLNKETDVLETTVNASGNTQTLQAFSQVTMKVSEKVTINPGLHYIQLMLNNTFSLEPRVSATWAVTEADYMSLGYGLHSQIQPLSTYFGQSTVEGETVRHNENLKLTKAHHVVAGYDRRLGKHLRLKADVYYQHLFHLPIKNDPSSSFSIINVEGDFVTDALVNKGNGKNYGAEISLEQFMHNDLYFLLAASVYQSKYKALNGQWHNTRYNANANVTFTGGKEFKWRKNRVFGVNVRTIYTGGYRTTPIDLPASLQKGETVYRESQAFENQLPSYFRADLRLSLKRNKENSTHTVSLDIQNITNRLNVYNRYFDSLTGKATTSYQAPLIPVLSYKVEF